jgi:hypothetical protein
MIGDFIIKLHPVFKRELSKHLKISVGKKKESPLYITKRIILFYDAVLTIQLQEAISA